MRASRESQRHGLRRAKAAAGALLLTAAFGLPPEPAAAQQLGSHLECFRLRTRGTTWTANAHAGDVLDLALPATLTPPFAAGPAAVELLAGSDAEPDELCVPVRRDPGSTLAGSDLGNALACYDLEHRRATRTEIALADELGEGTVILREGTRKLCVPVAIP